MGAVSVPRERWGRWVANFEAAHGATTFAVLDGALSGRAADASCFVARLPLDADYRGEAEPGAFGQAGLMPTTWGLLLVRKGGFAVARLSGARFVESKVGRRHVQGRTKAGGQSQQRFARRRDNQARMAYRAATDHAVRVLGEQALAVVVGGDHQGVEEVLAEPRLGRLQVVGPWLNVADPRRGVLEQAARDAASIRVGVVNA